jgi:hypothetical protein
MDLDGIEFFLIYNFKLEFTIAFLDKDKLLSKENIQKVF